VLSRSSSASGAARPCRRTASCSRSPPRACGAGGLDDPALADSGRFDAALRGRVQKNLAGFARQTIAPDGRRPAAVAVVLLADEQGRACFLLTRRTATLRAHARQWALPGGRIDGGETAEGAALRELREVVDRALENTSVLGLLDDYGTRSGFIITPVVAWAGERVELTPNPDEVATIYRVALTELDKPSSE